MLTKEISVLYIGTYTLLLFRVAWDCNIVYNCKDISFLFSMLKTFKCNKLLYKSLCQIKSTLKKFIIFIFDGYWTNFSQYTHCCKTKTRDQKVELKRTKLVAFTTRLSWSYQVMTSTWKSHLYLMNSKGRYRRFT